MYSPRNAASWAISDTGPTAARRPSLRAKLRTGRATSRKTCRTTRPTTSGRTWNLEPPRGSTKVVTRLIVANTTMSTPITKPIQTMRLCFLHDQSTERQGAGAARAARLGRATARSPGGRPRCSAYLRILRAVRARALGPYLLDTGERGAELVDPSSFVPPDQLDAPGERLAAAQRAIPASMRVSRTWRCDIRNRVMTGTLAVVNERVVPPAVAPQETTRPKRACASSAMRTRCSLVSSRNRSIRASSAVAAASGGGALVQFHRAERRRRRGSRRCRRSPPEPRRRSRPGAGP